MVDDAPQSEHDANVSAAAAKNRGKTAQAKQQTKVNKSDLEHYFGQLTGTEEPDFDVVRPKLVTLAADTTDIILNLKEFSRAIAAIGYQTESKDINTFLDAAAAFRNYVESVDTVNLTGEIWHGIKTHDFVQTCLVTCNKIAEIHAQFVHSWATADRKFMNRYPGLVFKPFSPWCDLDIKRLWLIDGETQIDLREIIFTVLKNIFGAMREMYDIYMSPDVDISRISEIIVSSLGDLKKRIPRCEKAFAQIERSAIMLKENFSNYYQDYLETKDPNNIFTAFISDVGKSCGNDTQLIFQCSRIVQFYKKHAQMKIASGEITGEKRKMFESLLDNYKNLERAAATQAGMKLDEPDDTIVPPPTPEQDARDIDELMSQINNPRVLNISDKPKRRKKKPAVVPVIAAEVTAAADSNWSSDSSDY